MSLELKNINLDNIIFSKTKHKSNNNFLYVYYDKKPLMIKMPKMRLPFGIKKDTLSQKSQYILDMSYENNDDLLRNFQQMDEYIIKKCQKDIYPDKTIEEVTAMYVSCIKYPNDTRYYPTIRTKMITTTESKIKCDFYLSEKDETNNYPKVDIYNEGGETYIMNTLNKNNYIESIVECIGLWIREDKFGLSFKVNQIKLFPVVEYSAKPAECQFVDSDESTSDSEIDFLD